jgi:hypothetical protein
MRIEISDWWKDFIIKLLLIWSIIKIIAFVYNIYQVYLTVRNPLIPDTLFNYVAFQNFLLILLWTAILVGCIYLLIKRLKIYNTYFFIVVITFFIIQTFEAYLYQILLRINPFG